MNARLRNDRAICRLQDIDTLVSPGGESVEEERNYSQRIKEKKA